MDRRRSSEVPRENASVPPSGDHPSGRPFTRPIVRPDSSTTTTDLWGAAAVGEPVSQPRLDQKGRDTGSLKRTRPAESYTLTGPSPLRPQAISLPSGDGAITKPQAGRERTASVRVSIA